MAGRSDISSSSERDGINKTLLILNVIMEYKCLCYVIGNKTSEYDSYDKIYTSNFY